MKKTLFVFALLLSGCATVPPQTVTTRQYTPRKIQKIYTVPGTVHIPGGDGQTSGVVNNLVLTLTRDYTTNNQFVTYWDLRYNYYNGSYRWETGQELDLDFTNSVGTILTASPAISVPTPSTECHYGNGLDMHQTGTMAFDFTLVPDLRIVPTGQTTNAGPDKDHKCFRLRSSVRHGASLLPSR